MRKSKERWSEVGAVKEKAERFNLGGDRGKPKLLNISGIPRPAASNSLT